MVTASILRRSRLAPRAMAMVVTVRLLQQALARRIALHALELPATCKFAGYEGDARELMDLYVDVQLGVSRE